MTLPGPDRKRLWGKAANRCAVCRDLLTRPTADGDSDSEAIVGEEAHIVGARKGSARHTLMDSRDCDGYENRILLCPNHHLEIDSQPNAWPVSRLRKAKADHEASMERLTSAPAGQEDSAQGITLRLLLGGDAIVGLISTSDATQVDYEHLATDAERGAARRVDWRNRSPTGGRSSTTSAPGSASTPGAR